jgi:NAD(P)-dependent dehydrogenase (short-subunit alcohol dehydrogenase family)
MTPERKVAVITGASRGIGACLMQGFREIGYGVVANSRSIGKADIPGDPDILLVDGDIVPIPPNVSSAQPSRVSDGSTRWSITPGSSSPSLSLNIPRPISRR